MLPAEILLSLTWMSMRLLSHVQVFSSAKTVTLPASYRPDASGSLHIRPNLAGLRTHCGNAVFLMIFAGCISAIWANDAECADWLMWNARNSDCFLLVSLDVSWVLPRQRTAEKTL